MADKQMSCEHKHINTFFLHDGTPAQFWACTNCMVKFVPITNELRLERERDEARKERDDLRLWAEKRDADCAKAWDERDKTLLRLADQDDEMIAVQKERDALRAERDVLRADAERYRRHFDIMQKHGTQSSKEPR